jgi:hypothetical protein
VAAKAGLDHKLPADMAAGHTDRGAQGRQHSHSLEHFTWQQIMLPVSDRFVDHLVYRSAGMQRPVLAGDCVRAAYDLTGYLGISHALWAEACAVLGHSRRPPFAWC